MFKRIMVDVALWTVAAVICMIWRLALDKATISEYLILYGGMMLVWLLFGFIFRKYRSYKETWYWQEMLSMLSTAAVLWLVINVLLPKLPVHFSPVVANLTVGIVVIMDSIVILVKHYYKYALNLDVPAMEIEMRDNAVVKRQDERRTDESIATIRQAVLSLTTEADYEMLVKKANLNSRQTKSIANRDRFGFMQIPDYQYSTLVDLRLLNEAKGLNRRFCIVNQKLPDNGVYVCCYRPQEYVKKKILQSYPVVINWMAYTTWFVLRRVIPRLLMTSRLYYDVTDGRKRVLSKTEVLGRLYYCGFEVDEIVPMGHIEYVFAHRRSQPYPQEQMKLYGPLISLPRVCKDKKIVHFYKFRTMHPYSEYIQKYVFDQRGGMNIADKSDDDFRITTWGKIMRKYWLDELPMILNFLKGDIKLVGVRPLSRTMFDTYPPELQDKRTRCKPGLIPPFYIDHPKTFDELFASEEKYLDEYFKHPFLTDCSYFFRTMWSILFKKMHSA